MHSSQNKLLIITSPPASGKTYWIRSYGAEIFPRTLLVISPLRALADECKNNFATNTLVMTPEEWMGKKTNCDVVIFDEFHLWFYWGDSFRPRMWEAFYELVQGPLTILLTATLGIEMQNEIKLMTVHFDSIEWCDYGNRKLRYSPHRYIKAASKKWMLDMITLTRKDRETSLIFCAFRGEVFSLGRELRKQGFVVWTCVGGEAAEFSVKVRTQKAPDFIVSTSVLSHGVNLPVLSKVYLLYALENIDFWIQMVARGGRRGEKFDVIALEKPIGIKWNPLSNFLAIWCLDMKMGLVRTGRQVQAWFLKESSSTEFPTKNAI